MNTNGFSIEIVLKPASYHESGFNFLFAIHDGNDGKQLVIGGMITITKEEQNESL